MRHSHRSDETSTELQKCRKDAEAKVVELHRLEGEYRNEREKLAVARTQLEHRGSVEKSAESLSAKAFDLEKEMEV
jgi:hypothetical protein